MQANEYVAELMWDDDDVLRQHCKLYAHTNMLARKFLLFFAVLRNFYFINLWVNLQNVIIKTLWALTKWYKLFFLLLEILKKCLYVFKS